MTKNATILDTKMAVTFELLALQQKGKVFWMYDTFLCNSTISNTRATFAYYSFCDNLRLQCTLRLLSLFAVIFKLISSEKK